MKTRSVFKTSKRIVLSGLALASVGVLGSSAAWAAPAPKLEATFSDWKVYSHGDGSQRVCYVTAKPRTKLPKNVRHGDVFFLVSSWVSGAAKEQPSLMAGYSLKVNQPPSARVGSAKVPMFVAQNEAFIDDNSDEQSLVKKMRAGSVMRIEATSTRGTATSYEFSLKGVSAALKKVKSTCG